MVAWPGRVGQRHRQPCARRLPTRPSATREAVIRGFVDPLLGSGDLSDRTPEQQAAINTSWSDSSPPGGLLRIKVWRPDGEVVYSDLPALRGAQFPIADDLEEALDGEACGRVHGNGNDEENEFEHGLASELLSIYLPIHGTAATAKPIGVYEIYEDAAPIDAEIAATRSDVLRHRRWLCGLALLLVLFSALPARRVCCLARTSCWQAERAPLPLARPELDRRQHDRRIATARSPTKAAPSNASWAIQPEGRIGPDRLFGGRR